MQILVNEYFQRCN